MNTLAERIIKITAEYVGPASQRFLERQASHVNGLTMDNIDRNHLQELAKWVLISGKLIIDEKRAVELAQRVANA
jgi:hypothetical protein